MDSQTVEPTAFPLLAYMPTSTTQVTRPLKNGMWPVRLASDID